MAVERREVGMKGGYGQQGVLATLPTGIYREVIKWEELNWSRTTSTAFQPKINQTITLEPGDYRLHWGYQWNKNTAGNDFLARLTVDGSTSNPATGFDWMRHQQEPKDSGGTSYPAGSNSGTNQSHVASGHADFTIATLGVKTFALHYASANSGNAATIWAARLRIERRIT